jgi:AcrR family transcriptional regulator
MGVVGVDTDAERLIEAALGLAAETGWQQLSLAAAAQRAGVSLVAAYEAFPDKRALVDGILGRIDRRVLMDGPAAAEDSPRDRLFEILMRRFDALQADRSGMVAILRGLPMDPLAALAAAPALARSVAWVLEAAGLSAQGIVGLVRINAIALVYLAALRVWLNDDSPDMARTMAMVDRGLREAEGLARQCPLLARTSGDAAVTESAAAALAANGAAPGSAGGSMAGPGPAPAAD